MYKAERGDFSIFSSHPHHEPNRSLSPSTASQLSKPSSLSLSLSLTVYFILSLSCLIFSFIHATKRQPFPSSVKRVSSMCMHVCEDGEECEKEVRGSENVKGK